MSVSINMPKKLPLLLVSLTLFLFLQCKKEDDKQNELVKAGTVLVLSSSANPTQATNTTATGLTIKIPDGVPLKSQISSYNSPKKFYFRKLMKKLGIASSASAKENEWAFVRQSALWANNNSDTIEAILGPIKQYNLLNTGTNIEKVIQTPKGDLFIIKLTVNANITVSSSAFTGTKTYKHVFEMWRQSSKTKALEMFFDSADVLTDKGILLLYNLNIIDPISFPDSLLCETYVSKQDSSYLGNTIQSQKQTISWSGAQQFYSGADKGRVVLEKMDNDTILCFKSVVRFPHNASIFPNCGSSTKYYSLAYSQFLTTEKKEATAKLSLMDSAIDNTNAQLCGLISRNYGLFENSGFINDEVIPASVPATYPQVSRVDKLFGTIGTTGAGVWDDLSKTKLDSINIQFQNSLTAPSL